ncbi:MAG TPA: hypothetical protein PKC58_17650 [Ignavibacteria bacterium]|nr:hypothetical protein [Ignavibacteria bacterium]
MWGINFVVLSIVFFAIACVQKSKPTYWVYETEYFNIFGKPRGMTFDTVLTIKDTIVNGEKYVKLTNGKYVKFGECLKYFDIYNGFEQELYPEILCDSSFVRVLQLWPPVSLENKFVRSISRVCLDTSFNINEVDYPVSAYFSDSTKAEQGNSWYEKRIDYYNCDVGIIRIEFVNEYGLPSMIVTLKDVK